MGGRDRRGGTRYLVVPQPPSITQPEYGETGRGSGGTQAGSGLIMAPLAGEGVHCDRIAVNMPNVYREILIGKR